MKDPKLHMLAKKRAEEKDRELRDYYAGLAMQSLIQSDYLPDKEYLTPDLVYEAFEIADWMMKERLRNIDRTEGEDNE